MTDIPSALKKIQIEETAYRSSVSEATMQKIGGTCNAIIDQGIESLGTVVQSLLTETQFQAIKSNAWVRMSGQSIVGSDLNTLTGITSLPNMIGNSAFLRQASSEGNIGLFQSDQNKSHKHDFYLGNGLGGTYPANLNSPAGFGGAVRDSNTTIEGGSEARPVNYQINFFIKINNNPTP